MITAFPDMKIVEIESDFDFIVIACDGVWDCKSNQEVGDFVYARLKQDSKQKLSLIIEELLDNCLATDMGNATGVGCDNMTCVIIQFKR